jgi:hypothetical protein
MSTGYIVSDTALNDSDKEITPPGRGATLRSVRVEYTATATVGTRIIEIQVLDATGGDVVHGTRQATNVTASQVMIVNYSPGAPTNAPTDGALEGSQAFGAFVFEPAWRLRVVDTAAIAAAADDMVVHTVWSVDP